MWKKRLEIAGGVLVLLGSVAGVIWWAAQTEGTLEIVIAKNEKQDEFHGKITRAVEALEKIETEQQAQRKQLEKLCAVGAVERVVCTAWGIP